MKYLLICLVLILQGCGSSEPEPTLIVNNVNNAKTLEEVNLSPGSGVLDIKWKGISSDVDLYLVTKEKQTFVHEDEIGAIKLGSISRGVNKLTCEVDASYVEVMCSLPDGKNYIDMTELVHEIPQELVLYIRYTTSDGSINSTGVIVFLN
ncbi:hypothetical protein [Psychrobium sp. 1_MG-2023]|uniref:hypothetical protein n=1 Tax=Psychrobium sp. 1_MG-2023 TaxID=3062624 RepID=UPI000C3422EC|nr:hypothetical protein [Psychrobium sp. 1_MG-2023]MDP2561193.1 hypothetical protein [Psychrobium sp. 1_MG-2023]PKF55301.1 hypothetical protein CW748_13880 [Alteromonadales bacterium alter-6D02]